MKKLFVFFLFLTSCAIPFESSNTQIDVEFLPYLNTYRQYKLTYLKTDYISNIDIIFFSLNPPTIGTCKFKPNGEKLIKIDPVYWFFGSTSTQKELLLLHELGHCDLDRDHSDASSIMEKSIPFEFDYVPNKSYYLEEFFQLIPTRNLHVVQ